MRDIFLPKVRAGPYEKVGPRKASYDEFVVPKDHHAAMIYRVKECATEFVL